MEKSWGGPGPWAAGHSTGGRGASAALGHPRERLVSVSFRGGDAGPCSTSGGRMNDFYALFRVLLWEELCMPRYIPAEYYKSRIY